MKRMKKSTRIDRYIMNEWMIKPIESSLFFVRKMVTHDCHCPSMFILSSGHVYLEKVFPLDLFNRNRFLSCWFNNLYIYSSSLYLLCHCISLLCISRDINKRKLCIDSYSTMNFSPRDAVPGLHGDSSPHLSPNRNQNYNSKRYDNQVLEK